MGKKNFFKFPSKKTLEYILIGILFVAVLSCTMKMIKMIKMNGSFIEGFGAATADADVCGTVGTPTVAVCELNNDFVPTEAYNVDGTGIGGSWYRTIRIALPPMTSQNAVKLYAPAATTDNYIIILFNETISTASLTIAQILYSSSDTTAAYTVVPSADWTLDVKVRKITDQSIDYLEIISKNSSEPTDLAPLTPTTSLNIIATISVIALSGSTPTESEAVAAGGPYNATKSTCEEIMFLNGSVLPDTTPTETCIGDCYTFTDEDTSPCSGPNSLGCQSEPGDAAAGGGNCLCGDGIGDGGEMKFYEEGSSWPYSYPTDPNSADGTQITGLTLEDTESCLKSAIDQSKISATNNAATNNADLCHPRWPCISSMSDYLEILNTPLIAPVGNPTADVCNKTVTGDDLDNQNKIPISLCVPYDNADGNDSDCYGLHTIGECESVQNDDDDSTNKKCVWNPYCQMPNNGRDNLGNETSEETRTSKVYTDMLTCIKSGNIWDLPMMEELNDKRDDDNKIIFPDGIEHYTNTTEFGYDAIKSAMRGNGLGCHVEGNGGALMCAVSSSAYNSAGRLYGQCPGNLEHSPCIQDEEITDSGDQGSCTYCRTTNTNSTVVDSTVKTIQDVDPTGATTFFTDTFGITPSGDPTDCVNIYHI